MFEIWTHTFIPPKWIQHFEIYFKLELFPIITQLLYYLWFLIMAAIQNSQYHIEVEDWPKLSGVQFLLQVSTLTLWVTEAILWFLVMVAIQDGQQVASWSPKLICSQSGILIFFLVFFCLFQLDQHSCMVTFMHDHSALNKKVPKNCQKSETFMCSHLLR